MENRVYYGEYSLKHWIELVLKQNIILPKYQRYFVWNETKVKTLIDTFKKKQFIPPVTIGAFKNGGEIENLILDGQQRLTSILIAYLGIFPDEAYYKRTIERFADENDDVEVDEEELDNILDWTFKNLTEKGNTKQIIKEKLLDGNYKYLDVLVDEEFLKNTFLGFSYLVPVSTDQKEQQKYYSSVFRNINIQGETLLPQESRASLYYLDETLVGFFDPDFARNIIVRNSKNETKTDFVRFLSLLSQLKKNGNSSRIARGYKPRMERYYEEYIYSVVGENTSSLFVDFNALFPNKDYNTYYQCLEETILSLELPKQLPSIIDLDVYLFGLIYNIVFEKKKIDITRKNDLKKELEEKIAEFKRIKLHTKSPNALKYLKSRIDASIVIYNRYEI